MAQPFVGEIRMFAGNFAPAGWVFCDGQLLPISENETLFNLIGTTYGGDGQATFALPDLRGRLPIHQGSGFILAETGGAEEVTLTTSQMPAHTHRAARRRRASATTRTRRQRVLAQSSLDIDLYIAATARRRRWRRSPSCRRRSASRTTNLQPYLCVELHHLAVRHLPARRT